MCLECVSERANARMSVRMAISIARLMFSLFLVSTMLMLQTKKSR